jgi:hypothetical protein
MSHCGYFLSDTVFAFGGHYDRTAEQYSKTNDEWQSLPTMPFKTSYVQRFTVALCNGSLFIAAYCSTEVIQFIPE